MTVEGADFTVRTTRNPCSDGTIVRQVRECLARDLPELRSEPAHDRIMVVAGSGPSLRLLTEGEGDIFALGGAHDWLVDRGIVPHAWINADPLPLVANYLQRPHPNVTYYIASHSHRFVFDALRGYRVTVWHDETGVDLKPAIREARRGQEHILVCGGSTGATRAPFLGYELGYRTFRFRGVDGSGGYITRAQRLRGPLAGHCAGKAFAVPPNFIHQAKAFETMRDLLTDCRFEFMGDGLMAHLFRSPGVEAREAA